MHARSLCKGGLGKGGHDEHLDKSEMGPSLTPGSLGGARPGWAGGGVGQLQRRRLPASAGRPVCRRRPWFGASRTQPDRWKRCAEGQRWVRNSCVGSAMEVTATAAADRVTAVNASARGTQNAGQTSWRLPRLHELRWLVEAGCLLPAINQTQFPRTPAAPFWTETPFLGASNSAWTVDFAGGNALGTHRQAKAALRLVRVSANEEVLPRALALASPPRAPARQRQPLCLSGLCVPQRRHPSPTSSPSTGRWCRSPRRPSTSFRRHRPVRTAGKPRNAITRAVRLRGYGT